MFQGKRKSLGRFAKFQDAVKARIREEERLHDDFVAAFMDKDEKMKENPKME